MFPFVAAASSYGKTGAISVSTMAWFCGITDVLTQLTLDAERRAIVIPPPCPYNGYDGRNKVPAMWDVITNLLRTPTAVDMTQMILHS